MGAFLSSFTKSSTESATSSINDSTKSLSCACSYCAKSVDNVIEKLIYFPPPINESDFRTLNTNQSKLLHVVMESNLKISTVIINPVNNDSPKKYIVFSHGNGGDILNYFPFLVDLANKLNVGVIAYDYIGYGLSENIPPTEQGCYDSMEAVMNYVIHTMQIDKKNVYLIGQSLGTGITIDYASNHDWMTPIILISPYKSICRVVADSCLVSSIDKFTTLNKLEKIKCPVKIFHGKDDNVINISHGMEIYNNLVNKSLEPVWFDRTGHNDILYKIDTEHYLDVLM